MLSKTEINNMEPLERLLFHMADDLLILGHRNSEWTGIGPVLEEDIAFASMAQDKIGQAQALYKLINAKYDTDSADQIAFNRKENAFFSCQFVEYPIGEYDFSLVRHFLFDIAQMVRFDDLIKSSNDDLRIIAKKYQGELKYHVMHANIWMEQLMNGSEESKARINSSINNLWPKAHSIFESFEGEDELIYNKIYSGERELLSRWQNIIIEKCKNWGILLDDIKKVKTNGGRKNIHTEFLSDLLLEMTEVFNIEPSAEW
jgi:ring-1,2-phenylacetyl-CoA epoxidase subunit PaaC